MNGSGRVAVFIDLDRTVIYSASALDLPRSDLTGPDAAAPALRCVEVYQGRPLSFITETTAGLLRELAGAAVLVPTSTRTEEQLARVRLPGCDPARFAIAANGGLLLVDGVIDPAWTDRMRRRLADCAPPTLVAAQLQASAGPFVTSVRVASALFVYAVADRAALPGGWLADLAGYCEPLGYAVSVQGRKVYCVPVPLTKAAAMTEVRERVGARLTLAAGDSLLDASLLAAADRAVRPCHGELADRGWTCPGLHIIDRPGVLGGQDLVAWLLTVARGGGPQCGGGGVVPGTLEAS